MPARENGPPRHSAKSFLSDLLGRSIISPGWGCPSSEHLSKMIENVLETMLLNQPVKCICSQESEPGPERLQLTPDLMLKNMKDNL